MNEEDTSVSMRTTSYESILSAVGRVLDAAEAREFALREHPEGLLLEWQDASDAHEELHLTLTELAHLLDWHAETDTEHAPHYERATAANEGTLRQFLDQHTLVTTR